MSATEAAKYILAVAAIAALIKFSSYSLKIISKIILNISNTIRLHNVRIREEQNKLVAAIKAKEKREEEEKEKQEKSLKEDIHRINQGEILCVNDLLLIERSMNTTMFLSETALTKYMEMKQYLVGEAQATGYVGSARAYTKCINCVQIKDFKDIKNNKYYIAFLLERMYKNNKEEKEVSLEELLNFADNLNIYTKIPNFAKQYFKLKECVNKYNSMLNKMTYEYQVNSREPIIKTCEKDKCDHLLFDSFKFQTCNPNLAATIRISTGCAKLQLEAPKKR